MSAMGQIERDDAREGRAEEGAAPRDRDPGLDDQLPADARDPVEETPGESSPAGDPPTRRVERGA